MPAEVKWFRVTITDHDYHYTRYSVAVEARSVHQAIALGSARVGQAKAQKEGFHTTLLDPEVITEKIGLDAYWAERDEVAIHE